MFFFFRKNKAYELRISYWSSDVCSSALAAPQQSVGQPLPSWAVRLRRTSLGLGLLAAVGSGVAAGPWLTLCLVTALVILLRSVSLSSTAATQRRNRRGATWYDGLLDVLAAPVPVLVSLPPRLLPDWRRAVSGQRGV